MTTVYYIINKIHVSQMIDMANKCRLYVINDSKWRDLHQLVRHLLLLSLTSQLSYSWHLAVRK